MPYRSVSELPKQFKRYSPHGRKAAMEAFNSAYKEYGGNEQMAFATAHTAAQDAMAKMAHQGGAPKIPST